MRRPPGLVFLHVPKTAGTSLVARMEREYGSAGVVRCYAGEFGIPVSEVLAWPRRRQRRMRVVTGHFAFGLAARLAGSWEYVTLLRDPVDRIVSHYYYVLTEPTLVDLHDVRATGESLVGHVTGSPLRHLVNDAQTRQLGTDLSDEPRAPTERDLDRALARLDEELAVIGLHDRYDETVELLEARYGWGEHEGPRLNVTAERPAVAALDPEVRATIEAHNRLDVALHAAARARFERLRAAAGLPPSQAEVRGS